MGQEREALPVAEEHGSISVGLGLGPLVAAQNRLDFEWKGRMRLDKKELGSLEDCFAPVPGACLG